MTPEEFQSHVKADKMHQYYWRIADFIRRYRWRIPKPNDPKSLEMLCEYALVLGCQWDFDLVTPMIERQAYSDAMKPWFTPIQEPEDL
jgi:hypothetical protein